MIETIDGKMNLCEFGYFFWSVRYSEATRLVVVRIILIRNIFVAS